jgi:phosphoglycolate phosphatase-like HAD superfamily hydrolase
VITAVLLDVDGTLVDSNDAHARAWHEALAEHGYDVPLARVRGWIGMGGDKLLPAATGLDAESAKGKAIAERRGEIFKQKHLPTVMPFPRVRELLVRMKSDGLKLAAASSAAEDELHALLEIANVRDLLEESTSSDDADRSKPDPDIVHAALQRLHVSSSRALMLGDTRYDVEAATRAGVALIALRCGGSSDADLSGAIAIHDDPADLLAHYASSPLARA